MIKIENVKVVGWEHAIRGMRNPKNSWDRSDSSECNMSGNYQCKDCHRGTSDYCIGANDLDLMTRLSKAGTDHRKFMRMIVVYADVTAPLYWWKEYDTYKVGTVANSCSTMHKIHDKEFAVDDFSCEHLAGAAMNVLIDIVYWLNFYRDEFIAQKDKQDWWQIIQLLPSSYNQKRTVMLNYEVLHNMYHSRKNHKLDEWHTFCDFIETLPYAKELIINE
jgi:hypothetical protein